MLFKDYIELKYYNNIFYLFFNNLLGSFIKRGKKFYAWNIIFKLKYLLKKKVKKDANIILLISLLNSLSKVHFIKKRFGSVRKEIPIELKFERSIKFAIKTWLNYSFINKKFNIKRLALLICAGFKHRGLFIRHKIALYKKAITNRILLNFIKR